MQINIKTQYQYIKHGTGVRYQLKIKMFMFNF